MLCVRKCQDYARLFHVKRVKGMIISFHGKTVCLRSKVIKAKNSDGRLYSRAIEGASNVPMA